MNSDLTTGLAVAAVIGLLPAWVASRKGYGFGKWWLFGALLFIVALPLALFSPQNGETRRQCPHCRVWIDRQATVCRQCGRDVPDAGPTELTAMTRLIEEQSRIPFSPRAPRAAVVPTGTWLDSNVAMGLFLGAVVVVCLFTAWVFL